MFLFATATFLYQIWQDHRRDHRNDQYQRSDRNHSFDSFIIKIHCFHLFKFSYPMGILGYILNSLEYFCKKHCSHFGLLAVQIDRPKVMI